MAISADRWQMVKAVVMRALELPRTERDGFVSAELGGDAELEREAVSLLRADERAEHDSLLPEPPGVCAGGNWEGGNRLDGAGGPDGSGLVGRRIGRYVVERLIGMGGMGAVYEARQDGLSRRVALKVMRAGLMSAAGRARFEREARLLGRLEHPGIARIYDSGVHETDLGPIPYFAMELVVGAEPITAYARREGLGLRERVRLFAGVCDAVHYGHQRGIIHRDLKPTNILVGRVGAEMSGAAGGLGGVAAKVIDLGVARSTDADVTLATGASGGAGLVGTLAYMSPEQCALDPSDLDIRSDVYALGVVLYELLTGRLPYDVSGRGLPEAARIIRERPADRPTLVAPQVSGDLSVIVLKCLSKDREARYGSAAEVSADLRRWLDRLPISARRASRMYQVRMFAYRHRPLVYGVCGVALALVAGLIGTSLALRQAMVERDRAEQVAGFLGGVLRATVVPIAPVAPADAAVSPIEAGIAGGAWLGGERLGGEWPGLGARAQTPREVLLRAREGLERGAVRDARVEAEVRAQVLLLLTMGEGTSEENERLMSRGPVELEQIAGVLGWTHELVQRAGVRLAAVSAGSGRLGEAQEIVGRLARASEALWGSADVRTLELGRLLASYTAAIPGTGERALALADRLVEDATRAHGAGARATLVCRLTRASTLTSLGRRGEAASEARAVMAAVGPGAAETDALMIGALHLSVVDVPTVPAVEANLRHVAEARMRVVELMRQASGGDGRQLFDASTVALGPLIQLGEFERAAAMTRQVVEDCVRTLGPTFHATTKAQSRLARLMLWSGGDVEEALRLARESHAASVAESGVPLGDYEVFHLATVYDALRARGDSAAALEGIESLIRSYRSRPGADGGLSWFGGYLHGVAAQSLEALGRVDEARARWETALEEFGTETAEEWPMRVVTLRLGSAFFGRHGPTETRERWRGLLRRVSLEGGEGAKGP